MVGIIVYRMSRNILATLVLRPWLHLGYDRSQMQLPRNDDDKRLFDIMLSLA